MKLMIQIQKKQFFFPASFQHRPLTGRGEGAAGGLCWQLRPALGAGPFDAAAAAEEGRAKWQRRNGGRGGDGRGRGEGVFDGKTRGNVWKHMENTVKYGELWTNMAKLWTKLDIASSLVP